MALIHFLRRSSSIFWISILLIALGWTTLNPINGYTANAEGLYSGSFSGERSGSWFLSVDESGNGKIYFWISTDQLVDEGKVDFSDKKKFTFNCTYGLTGSGSIDADGKIDGNWQLGEINGSLNGLNQDLEKVKSLSGNYSSTFKGSEPGDLNLTVGTNGTILGTASWQKTGLTEEGNGVADARGKFVFHTQDDTSIHGTITSSGEVNGNWHNPFWETKGTLGDTPIEKSSSTKNEVNSETMPVYVESQDNNNSGCFIEITQSQEKKSKAVF
ncbi:MAG: hypothetical protein PVI90_12090 [Desulfobacteraceae bacterium]|jgi:hypothetical protein